MGQEGTVRARLRRAAFLGLVFVAGTAEDCNGPRTCLTDYDCGLGGSYSCQAVGGQRVCLPSDPAQAAAILASYQNERAKICLERGHDFTGAKAAKWPPYPVAGKPNCQQRITQKQCRRCDSHITVAIEYEGDCGDLKSGSCE